MTSTLSLVEKNFSFALNSVADRVQANWENHKIEILVSGGIIAAGLALAITGGITGVLATLGITGNALTTAGSILVVIGTIFAASQALNTPKPISSNIQKLDVQIDDTSVQSKNDDRHVHFADEIETEIPHLESEIQEVAEEATAQISGSRLYTAAKYTFIAAVVCGIIYAGAKTYGVQIPTIQIPTIEELKAKIPSEEKLKAKLPSGHDVCVNTIGRITSWCESAATSTNS